MLVTGDIADHGLVDEYVEARELLVSRYPVLVLPGNHDARRPFAEVLLQTDWDGGPVNAAHLVGDTLFVLCDSSIPARDGQRVDEGLLEDRTLEWLNQALAAVSTHERAVVAMHHPPVDVHIPLMDPIRLTNPDALADVLARHSGVVAVLVGHAHTAAATTFAGLPAAGRARRGVDGRAARRERAARQPRDAAGSGAARRRRCRTRDDALPVPGLGGAGLARFEYGE